MRTRSSILVPLLLFLSGCATFKELEPKPPVQSGERGYIELQRDHENFVLKRNGQYFISFPRPNGVNFYLILQSRAKRDLHSYLTATFHDGEPPMIPITDEAAEQDSVYAFAVDSTKPAYYWVIDTVYADLELRLKYRYVPQWRYTVETKYDLFRGVLVRNTFDRHTYEAMGPQFDFATFNAAAQQQKLRENNKQLTGMNDELIKLEKVFPANIASSNDTMYLRYAGLRDDTKKELAFQSDYDAILTVLQREAETKGDFAAFVGRANEFESILDQKDRFRAPILEYLKSVYVGRLSAAQSYYDSVLQNRDDLSTIQLKPPFVDVAKLYTACGQSVPPDLQEMNDYVTAFNALAQKVKNAENVYEKAYGAMAKKTPWPPDNYYPDLIAGMDNAKFESPENTMSKFDRYQTLKITGLLTKGANSVMARIDQLELRYRRAADLVRQINALKPQKDYLGVVHILRNNRDLDFVLAQYSDVDDLLMKTQTDKIQSDLDAQRWKEAEAGLSDLFSDRDYLNLSQISPKKLKTVQVMENTLFETVKNLSYERADAFAKKNETTIDNVPDLYADSAFLPVYILTFSSESPGKVIQRNKAVGDYLDDVKYIQFPENSIKLIYKDLIRDPRDKGVLKARAILAHGKVYKGKDKSVRTSIDECDPMVAKTITKPKEYRRIFVIPVNETPSTSNEYVFRVNVRIPSEAQFPVYDINVKVPPAIAERAGEKQWFTSMTLNKKAVKTEGHMRITAPTSANDYEAQITPVQMLKGRDNIVEIRFKYPAFQLYEMSVMAQVPLIRKN